MCTPPVALNSSPRKAKSKVKDVPALWTNTGPTTLIKPPYPGYTLSWATWVKRGEDAMRQLAGEEEGCVSWSEKRV
jgi:hypothetical protein